MVSRYSVIQYVPNSIADERINIGVLVFDDRVVRVQFLQNWERVRNFGMEDISFLKNFAKRMKVAADDGLMFPGDEENNLSKQDRLTKIARGWINSIQFTEPRGALVDLDSLLEDISETFLVNPVSSQSKLRDRQAAAKLVKSKVRQTVIRLLGKQAESLVKEKYAVSGKRDKNEFDAVIANGSLYLAAHGISFEVNPPKFVVNDLSWMISDVKAEKKDFPLGVIVLPPKFNSKNHSELERLYKKTTATYSDLGAKVLQEEQIEQWLENNLKKLCS